MLKEYHKDRMPATRYYRRPDVVTIEELDNGLYLVHTDTTEFTIDKETLDKEYLAI